VRARVETSFTDGRDARGHSPDADGANGCRRWTTVDAVVDVFRVGDEENCGVYDVAHERVVTTVDARERGVVRVARGIARDAAEDTVG
jgi:hypothetical protein